MSKGSKITLFCCEIEDWQDLCSLLLLVWELSLSFVVSLNIGRSLFPSFASLGILRISVEFWNICLIEVYLSFDYLLCVGYV